jgi:NAD(P)-dependent dehydrogenase (short-subunit alcohol dehydrogenase family)
MIPRTVQMCTAREVTPLGIKVTIVEPGGFRTDFAGNSTELSEGHPEYDSTVGAIARFQRNYNGKQRIKLTGSFTGSRPFLR